MGKNKKLITTIINIIIILIVLCTIAYIIIENKKTTVVDEESINLSDYTTNVKITKGGEYTLTGTLTNSVIVDAKGEDVTLILDSATINATETAGIIGKNVDTLTISLSDDSTNYVTDGGESEYDAAIFSNGKLVITGNGVLYVEGNQTDGEGIATETNDMTIESGIIRIKANDDGLNAGGDGGLITINGGQIYIQAQGDGIDSNKNLEINGGEIFAMGSENGGNAGIDTDDGYTINGGTVVAVGTDMIESPKTSSKQNTILFTLDDTVEANTLVSLETNKLEEIISFAAATKFKTLIISTPELVNGTYTLYENGSHTGTLCNGIFGEGKYSPGVITTVNNTQEFTVKSTVTMYGVNNNTQRP